MFLISSDIGDNSAGACGSDDNNDYNDEETRNSCPLEIQKS